MEDLLIKWFQELNDKFIAVGNNGLLGIDIGAFNADLYSYVTSITRNVVMPIAYVILSLFFLLELYHCSLKADGAGGGTTLGAEIIFRALVKMALCKLAVDNTLLIMQAVYGVGQSIVLGIANEIGSGAVSGGLDMAAIEVEIHSLNFFEQLGMMIELVIIKGGVTIILGLVEILCIGRFIEIYVYIAVSPIPLSTFPSDELSQIAKNFLKSFAAVCLQGAFIYLVLSFFPILVNANILGGFSSWSLLFYSLVLAIGVFSSQKWAKAICNAM